MLQHAARGASHRVLAAAAPPNLECMAEIEIERDLQPAEGASIAEQRRALPDEPGVYIFRDSEGKVLYVGKARSIRKRVGGHFSGKTRTRAMTEQASSIEFLVTNTEADALLAEQQFIKRHRPTFNIRLRDDKSYPYIGISLDEEFPRVYFTRERHRSARLYFGPYSNAKRTRETLEILGKLFQYRTCDGPEPGRRSGVPMPRLLHQALPGALRRLHRPRGVPAEHRRDRELPLGPLPRRRARPRAQDGGGLQATRSSSARPSTATAWRRCARSWSAVAWRGRPWTTLTSSRSRRRTTRRTPRSSRSATASSPSARAST